MRLLIDIGHPAHIHYFKNLAKHFMSRGDKVLFTCRDKDVVIALLDHYGFEYINFGKSYESIVGKIFGMLRFTGRLLFVALRFKPDILFNASPYSAFAAYILGKPHISLEDTFNNEQVKLVMPFTSIVLTGDYEHPDLGRKEIRYAGYQELLYLHPNRFKPDDSIFGVLGIEPEEKYVIIRFVAWHGSHDVGHYGISMENKLKAVREFSRYAKVFIASEKDLPEELQPYKIRIPPERMHDALAFASLVYGESATMVSEGAVLGTPGVYLDNTGRYYTKDQEETYELVFNYSESESDQRRSIEKGIELLQTEDLKQVWKEKRNKMLHDKIDVSALLIWLTENWPESRKELTGNPEYQLGFK